MFYPLCLFLCFLVAVAQIEAAYTTVRSKYNESHSIRHKEHKDGEICNGGGKHYTGWADIADRHLFYWYHPVRHGKEEDAPLLIWLQGGPGASSMLGMLMLHGPCLVDEGGNGTTFNPHSWNEEFNVLYLDQPAGVGFSYVDDFKNNASYPRRTEESAHELLATVNLIYEAFPQLTNTSLFLTGESYGGRYVPTYGSAILDWNARVEEERRIPLVSIMIGDGWTSPRDQFPTFYDVGCFEVDGIPPVFNTTECAPIPPIVSRCETLLDACVAFPDELICKVANDYCQEGLLDLIEKHPVNIYDRTMVCPGIVEGDCYPEQEFINTFLNLEDTQEELEAAKETKGKVSKFQLAAGIIQDRYMASGDFVTSTTKALGKIIDDESVDVLLYVGLNDWVVTALGTERMLERMRFQKYAEFRGQTKINLPWKTKAGEVAGTVKKIDGLWLIELNGAGHLVPHDQPKSALSMAKAWKSEVEAKSATTGGFKTHILEEGKGIALEIDETRGQRRLDGKYRGLREDL